MLSNTHRGSQQCHSCGRPRQQHLTAAAVVCEVVPDVAEAVPVEADFDARTDRCGGSASSAVLTDSLLLGVELAPISPLELFNSCSGGCSDDHLPPDPPTVVINSEASPPTEKQKRIARVVMCVAFVLLATCVILVGVTLSMSDHIDDLVRKSHFHGSFIMQQQQQQQKQQQKQQQQQQQSQQAATISLNDAASSAPAVSSSFARRENVTDTVPHSGGN